MADKFLEVTLLQEGPELATMREVAECWVVDLANDESECDLFMEMLGMDDASLMDVGIALNLGFNDRGLAARRRKRRPMTL